MATSLGANRYNRQKWEDSDHPILCETCLGDNPYIRMTKEKYGKQCKICERPFTVFRWCPGQGMRFKKTEICQTCSKLKNNCQTCLLNLEYGLPVQTVAHALNIKDNIPKSDVNKEYYTQTMEREIANTDGTVAVGAFGKASAPSDMLLRMARTAPYYKRNRPHICSFWVKGSCKRGEECPYRHEKPTDPDDPLADQNIKDRYYGINDPVANKLLKQVEQSQEVEAVKPPQDRTITTLYIGGLGTLVGEDDLRNHFYQFGEITLVYMVAKKNCAFVQFARRYEAEIAARKSAGKLIVKGKRLVVRWGNSQSSTKKEGGSGDGKGVKSSANLAPVPGLPGALPMPGDVAQGSSSFFHSSNKQPYGSARGYNEPLPPGVAAASGSNMMRPPQVGGPPMMMVPPPPQGKPPQQQQQQRRMPPMQGIHGAPPVARPSHMAPIHYPSQSHPDMY